MFTYLKKLVPSDLRRKFGESSLFLSFYPPAKHNGLSYCFNSKWHIDFFNSNPEAYENLERKFVKAYVKPTDAVLEIGGCMGVVACETNRLLTKPSHHLVVEANPTSAAFLAKNRRWNKCDFNIENCLVSKSSDGAFYCHPHNPLVSTQKSNTNTAINVPILDIATLLSKWKISPTTLIMDIEGSECTFITENIAELPKLTMIICEFHPTIVDSREIDAAHILLRHYGFYLKKRESQHSHFVDVWLRNID